MTFSNSNSLNNKVLYCGLILILVLLLFSCKDQSPTVYTIIFDPNGGTLNGKQSVIIVEGMPVPEPEAPTKSGYIFDGWYSDADTSIPYDFDTPATSSFTLYAKWTAKMWTVTFLSDGGTEIDSQSVANCNRAVKPDDPEKEGYAFEGWYIQGTDTEYNFTLPVTSNLTLEARWSQYYTVTFDANLPDGIDAGEISGMPTSINNIPYGGTAEKPENPTIKGYQFDGWYSDVDTSIPYDFDTPVTSSFTLYAKWTAKTWTVTFLSDGGTEIDSQNVVNCNKAIKPEDPEKEGYTFEGWYIQGTDTEYDFTLPVTSNLMLYAKWSQITYTVTFDANLPDGVDDDSLSGIPETINSIPSGESVGKKTYPTLDGYVFKGWYRTENPDEDEDAFNLALDPVQENMILYAKWSTEATVIFNPNGGLLMGETEKYITYGGTLTELPADPVLKKDGRTYIFLGWYVDGELFDLSEPITNDTTVEAKWSDSYSNNAGYFVYDAEGLIAWAEAAQRDMDLNCTLENDIILPDVSAGERNWTAADPTLGYTGTFDGNSKTIMNLAGNQGIFGHIGEGGTVKSLTLENVSISSSSRVGAIAGSNQGTIEDCSVSGNIKGGEYVGGICGYNNVGKITDCHFSGSVEGTKSVGGVCGQSFYNSTITACYSTGSVSGSESVGGVCGATLEGTLIACYSTSYVKGTYKVGGVCGYLDEGTLTACYSTGSVEGKSWVGAVCGDHGGYYSSSTINACYWSVPSTTSSLVGIGSGCSLSAKTVEVTGGSVTWTEGDNSALSAMNAAISQNYKYAENTNPGTNAEMPLVLVPKK